MVLIFAASCIPPPTFPSEATDCNPGLQGGLLILSEGTFGNNEARLDYARNSSDSISCVSIFEKKNNQELGDVGQEMLQVGDRLYILVNNSHLVHELEFPSMVLLRSLQLPGGNRSSPRSLVPIGTDKLYITSLLDSGVYVVNTTSLRVEKKVLLGNYPEGIAVSGQKAFVSLGNYVGVSEPKLAVLDSSVDSLTEFIELPLANPGAVAEHQGSIWVACRGEFLTSEKKAGLVRINSESLAIEEVLAMSGNLQNELQTGKNFLFALRDSSIARLDLRTNILEENWIRREALTTNEFEYPYSLSLDEKEGLLYVGMAHGLGANGSIVVLNPFGQIERKIPSGRFPGQVLFWN